MPVTIQEVEVVPQPSAPSAPASTQPPQQASTAPQLALEHQIERATELARSRNIRLHAD